MTDDMTPDATNHDRRLAHSWAETVKANPDNWGRRQLAAARVILHDLPDQPPPTLADMTDEERAACKRMQADVAGHSTRYVILDPSDDDGEAALIDPDGRLAWTFPDYVTPRPDLPRMEWPGDTPAPAPDSTLAPGSTWGDGHELNNALKQSTYTHAAVADRDNDLAAWNDGYWDGAGFHPDSDPGEGPWKIISVSTEPEEA